MLEHRPSGHRHVEELIKNFQKLVDNKASLLGIARVKLKHIKTHRALNISGVKIDNIICPLFRNVPQNFIYQVSVRVYHGHSFAVLDVLNNHFLHKSGFSRAGLTYRIKMPPSVVFLNENIFCLSPIFALAYQYAFFRKVHGRGRFLRAEHAYGGSRFFHIRKMINTSNLFHIQMYDIFFIKQPKRKFLYKTPQFPAGEFFGLQAVSLRILELLETRRQILGKRIRLIRMLGRSEIADIAFKNNFSAFFFQKFCERFIVTHRFIFIFRLLRFYEFFNFAHRNIFPQNFFS